MIPYKWYCNHPSKKAKKVTPLSMSNSNRQFWCFMLSTLVMFFFLLSCTQALLPPSQLAWALLSARTPEQQGGVATEASSQWAGKLFILQMPEQNRHPKCSSTLNWTLVLPSSGGIGRREMQAMLCWTSQWKAFHTFMNKDFQLHTENVKAQGPMSRAYVCSAQTAMKSRQHCSEGDNELNTFLASKKIGQLGFNYRSWYPTSLIYCISWTMLAFSVKWNTQQECSQPEMLGYPIQLCATDKTLRCVRTYQTFHMWDEHCSSKS